MKFKIILFLVLLICSVGVSNATVPVISDLANTTPYGHTCIMTWSTDIITNNIVKYSINSDMSNPMWSTWFNNTTSINYITLYNLQLNTTYHWQAFSYNASDSSNSTVHDFVALPDVIRKNISVEIIWDTNNSATTGQIEYGLDSNYGNLTDIDGLSYWHPIEITNLTQGTTYHYRIREKDYKGENEIVSDDFTFTIRTSLELENLIKSARSGNDTPKIYYVEESGNNGNTGLSLGDAWATPTYAASQADVGDMVYVVNGSYFGTVAFNTDGISEAPITMKAYNGTPDITGQIDVSSNYITFDGFVCHDSASHGIDIRYNTGIKILNCEVYNSGIDCIYLLNTVYTILDNCTVHDSGWNGFGLKPSSSWPATGHHVMLKNCTAYDNTFHNAFDVQNDYATYENCDSNISDLAPIRIKGEHIVINNFTGENGNNGVNLAGDLVNSVIMNCTFPTNGIYQSTANSADILIYNNYLSWSVAGIHIGSNGSNVIEKNEIHTSEGWGYTYGIRNSGDIIIRDEVISPYNASSIDGVTITVEYIDGIVFIENGADIPKYYPSKSNYTFNSGIVQFTHYNITLKPTSGYLKDVTVNHESNVPDDRTNITVNSTDSSNPTWINVTMQNATNTYNVSVDGSYVTQVVSDSDKIVRYQYTSSWSSHDFEFEWYSTAGAPAWSLSIFGFYYNTTNPIKIITKGYGDKSNIFSRTITESDNNATSCRMVART